MPTDPKRVQDVFLAASEVRDPAERAKFLAEACGDDADLKVRVEALLRAHDQPDSLLDQPAVAPTLDEADAPDEVPLGFLSPPTRPDSLGRIGHYEVLQVLGQGGFGVVFRAFDDRLQRVVAVKVLFAQMAATSPARKRFLREARSSAKIRHENVVQVYEVGESPLPYIAMEYIPGETLQQRLDRSGPLDVTEVLRIGVQIAEGLAAAHATELIHRDIKPGNVLLESDQGKVKITDFGLARTADDASISQSGVVVGTPMYMAPEQARGEALDQRADLFSLGSLLYQMVTGRPPFRANSTLAVLKRVVDDAPRPIREIIPEAPPWLCDIIARLHAKNPAARFQTAREVADRLAQCQRDLAENRAPAPEPPAVLPKRRRRRVWALVALCVVALAVAAMFIQVGQEHANRPAVVTIKSNDPELLVTVDGQLVPLSNIVLPEGVKATYSGSTTVGARPGAHRLWAMKNGKLVYEQEFTAAAGEEITIDLAQAIPPAPPKPAAPVPPPGPRVLRTFDPAKDKPVPPPWANAKCVTVEDGVWRIENAERAGNFRVLIGTVLDGIPNDGLIVFRAKIKTKVKDPIAWGDLMLGVGSPSFHDYDWPAHLGEYRGDIAEWTPKEVRYPAAVFHKKNPPSIPVYVGLHADGVLWVKDAELLHIPPDPQKAAVLKPLREAITAKTKTREMTRHRFEAGTVSRIELSRAEAELTDARIALAEAEGDTAGVIAGLDQLVKCRQEERDLVATRVEIGADSPDTLSRADAQLTEAKVRRAKVSPAPRP